jgi:hypothetical protein
LDILEVHPGPRLDAYSDLLPLLLLLLLLLLCVCVLPLLCMRCSRAIKAWIAQHSVQHAVVVGGGFIGLEMVENLVHLGIKTTLVEMLPQVRLEGWLFGNAADSLWCVYATKAWQFVLHCCWDCEKPGVTSEPTRSLQTVKCKAQHR